MTAALALLIGGLLLAVTCHRPLRWLADRRVHPTILLTGWILAVVALMAVLVAVLGLLALSAAAPRAPVLVWLCQCWSRLFHGSSPETRSIAATLSALGTAALLARLGRALAVRTHLRRRQRPHLQQLRLLTAGQPFREPIWVRDDRALALSVGGRPGLILMSDTLRHRLTPPAFTAALEHERAHLRGRHHVLVAIVETLATALPLIPLLRAAPAAVKDLVELAADAGAARLCGTAAVREALASLTGEIAQPAFGLAMAERLIQARLTRLAVGSIGEHRAVRLVGCTAVAIGVLLLPAATGWLGMHLAGRVFC